MKRVKLLDIVERQGENKYSLLFLDEEQRALIMTTGYNEIWAIVVALKNIKPERPITHNLLNNIVSISGLEVKKVVIGAAKNNVFYGNIHFESKEKKHEIDCRPSDGIALAMQNSAPIYIEDEILNEHGTPLPEKYKNARTFEKGINSIITKSLQKQQIISAELQKATKEYISDITLELIDYVHSH